VESNLSAEDSCRISTSSSSSSSVRYITTWALVPTEFNSECYKSLQTN
jgi:hypothetical protein